MKEIYSCDDCVHLSSGFDWKEMEYTREPHCNYAKRDENDDLVLILCDKFYATEWLEKDFEEFE